MKPRTWDAYHRRDEVLRAVIDEVDARRDGALPMNRPGVAERFHDELDLLGALQLRWHTRLAGTIEAALMENPTDLRSAVVSAWRATATELAGVRQVLDAYTAAPLSEAMAAALDRARRKDWALMAAMTDLASIQDAAAAAVGRRIEEQARVADSEPPSHASRRGLPAFMAR